MAERRSTRIRDVWRVPLLTWMALCGLLLATLILAYVNLQGFNLPVSLCIAGVKAALVGIVFMRLSQGNALHWLGASAGPIWVFIMFILIGADYFTR